MKAIGQFILAIILVIIGGLIMILAGLYLFLIYKPLLWLSKKILGDTPSKKRANIWISICFFFKAIYDALIYAANTCFKFISGLPKKKAKSQK